MEAGAPAAVISAAAEEVQGGMGEAGRALALEAFNLKTQSAKLESHLINLAARQEVLP